MSFIHLCRCGKNYTDEDPDVYFCPACVEKRKALAKSVDEKVAMRPSTRQAKSGLQLYDEMCKVHGSRFVKMQDMGISV